MCSGNRGHNRRRIGREASDIKLPFLEGGVPKIVETRQRYDPLGNALIRPRGGRGRPLGAPDELGSRNVAPSEFASYGIARRSESANHIRQFGRLPRQYVCDEWSKFET